MGEHNLVILCGGKGTRIGKITKNIPKPIIKIYGINFLQHLINFYSKYNLKKIYLLAGYKGNMIKKIFHKKKFNLVDVECIIEKKPLGTGGSINLLPKSVKSFFLINGDSYIEHDFKDFIKFAKDKSAAMGLIENKNYKSNKILNKLFINSKKKIIISKKKNLMNAGIYFFKKNIFKEKIKKKSFSLENEIIPELIKNQKLFGKKLEGNFVDIGLYKNLDYAKKIIGNVSRPAIFLDRDGVIFRDFGYVNSLKRVVWTKNVFKILKKFKNYFIFIVTNQAGIARGYYSENNFLNFQKKIKNIFINHKIYIRDVKYCPHHPKYGKGIYKKKCLCRKPNNQMITNILKNWNIDKENSFFIGDSETDLAAAKKSRIKFIKNENNENFKDLFLKIQKKTKIY